MASIVALGERMFVRQLTLGGAVGRVVGPHTVVEALTDLLDDKNVGLVILDGSLVEHLPADLHRRAFHSAQPEVCALGDAWHRILRLRARQVLGADMLSERVSS